MYLGGTSWGQGTKTVSGEVAVSDDLAVTGHVHALGIGRTSTASC